MSNIVVTVSDGTVYLGLASPQGASQIGTTPSGNLTSTNVQAALNELQTDIDGMSTPTGSSIANPPSGNLTATTVQAALNQLQGEIDVIPDEVIENAGVLTGAAPIGAQWGINTVTGDRYYVSGGNWTIVPSAPIVDGTNAGLMPVGLVADAGKKVVVSPTGGYTVATTVSETVFPITGTVIDPTNGGIQTITLAANTTFTETLSDGDYITLMISTPSFTVTWPVMKWVGGTAPTLGITDYNVIILWKVGGILYGAYTGEVA